MEWGERARDAQALLEEMQAVLQGEARHASVSEQVRAELLKVCRGSLVGFRV